jgi:hypothetical protein
MSLDRAAGQTRRTLLRAAIGAVAATAVASVARVPGLRAANNEAVETGNSYTETNEIDIHNASTVAGDNSLNTTLSLETDQGVALVANGNLAGISALSPTHGLLANASSRTNGIGVQGSAGDSVDFLTLPPTGVVGEISDDLDGNGVYGHAPSGTGVQGFTKTGTAVSGTAAGSGRAVFGRTTGAGGRAIFGLASAQKGDGVGVTGESLGAAGTGVRGWAAGNGTGVIGFSGSLDPPAARAHTGVFGVAGGTTAVAMLGSAPQGQAVRGESASGTGGFFTSKTGQALHVQGKTTFSRSGHATVAAGASHVDVTVAGGLVGSPLCFANLMAFVSGVSVAAVLPNVPANGTLRIRLTRSVPTATPVAWIVMN